AKSAKWISECAKDLIANAKGSVVLAGYRQPLAVHIIASVLNSALGSEAVVFRAAPESKSKTISELAKSLDAGEVDSLIILGGNPVYNAPADLNFSGACKKAKTVVRLGYSEDETFAVSTWHLPMAHYLESWGDVRTSDGTLAPVQPLIEPLFGGLTEIEVLARIAGESKTRPHDIVRETFKEISKATDSDNSWKKFLHDGFLEKSAAEPISAKANSSVIGAALKNLSAPTLPSAQNLEVTFYRDYKVDDGRYINNGWLQELPDPVTKMTWENVILLSAKTAKDLGLKIENKEDNRLTVPRIKIQLSNREIEGPAWIQPGQADNIIGLALGYGRTQTGRVGRGSGFDAYKLRTVASPYFAVGAKIISTGKTHPLATTQDHGAMEGRPIIREANLEQFKKNPKFAEGMNMEAPPGGDKPLYPNPLDKLKEKALHQWGMSIDLNSCVGCSACVVACQSENNIPIVGKQQVRNNREMHWIRIDRYYAGAVTEPQMIHQPMLCQHCEAAPCENVCPVNATSHDEEGLNVMTYNRCVGTRYCSNNCPYKVRRFNFFDYNKRPLDQLYKSPITSVNDGQWELLRWFKDVDKSPKPADEWELLKLVKNPDVSVRMRGVMEKCSFCLQRIEQAKISQKVKAGASGDIRLKESEGTIPKTACQQACPAEAIVFGDISDSESRVSKLKAQDRDYTVLEFLLTKPRLTYLARVRNPNPSIDQYKEMPASTKEFEDKNGHPFEEMPHSAHGEKHSEKGAH
ncbi:MAG: 4Fe-4S dicluster domain-containing protein, partial [Verrucomicrobiota bacterium]|nr:4Fe-4S dicluster domain-containing protein [Verrucomicrobiota bacterium]